MSVSPSDGKFVSLEHWPYWFAFALVVLLMFLLVTIVFRRKRAGRGRTLSFAIAPLSIEEEPKQLSIKKPSLIKVWKGFLREIPAEFRRTVEYCQPFVVVGEAGSGKSLLISKYVDWRRQALQSCPSCTTSALFQIYLGSRSLVLELPALLLHDSTKATHDALLGLWKQLFKKRQPIVQIVLNGAALGMEPPDSLRRQAQAIRGKINALSRQLGKPVKTVISLTHMDQLEGYIEFSRFLYLNGAPFEVRIESREDLDALDSTIERYEAYLSMALTSLPSSDYLRIITFMRQMPSRLSVLSAFTKALLWHDPLSYTPEIIRINFTSYLESDATVSDPFASPISDDEIKNFNPWRIHQHAAAALTIAGCIYLLAGYFYERQLLQSVDHTMDLLEAQPPARYNSDWHSLFLDWTLSLEKDPALSFLPNFYPDLDRKIKNRLIEDIRKIYLLPKLGYIANEAYSQEKNIYLLGLLYGSVSNNLGPLILDQSDKWVKTLDLTELLIRDYVSNNYDAKMDLNWDRINIDSPKGQKPAVDPYPWFALFRKVNVAFQKDLITRELLLELQREANPLLEAIEQIYRFDLCGAVAERLKTVAPVGNRLDWVQRREMVVKERAIRDFLRFLKGEDLVYPPVQGVSLFQLMESAKVLLQMTDKGDKQYQFSFFGEPFVFDTEKWSGLMTRSRITLLLRDFMIQNRRGGGQIFFDKDDHYPDVLMNPGNDGLLFFVGKGKVDGKLTRLAFEHSVKPVLSALPEFLAGLPIAQQEKTAFSGFVYKEAEAYAEKYVSSYRAFYKQFNVQAGSMAGLTYVLNQIQSPSSQFQDFLITLKENTVLELGDSPYLRPMAIKLSTFEFVKRLMGDQKGVMPELDKYKAIMQQMQAELDSNEPFTSKNNADDAKELRAILSPAGRICLSFFRGESGSYASMTQMWLKSVGITPEWQQPFLAPVQQAYAFGQAELEASLGKIWKDARDQYLQPLATKFPFYRKAEVEISPAEVERLINPKGAFWKTFREYIGPVCHETGHTWFERKSSLEYLRLPNDMLKVANSVYRITTTLWDDNGEPKPLAIALKAEPLPSMDGSGPIPVMAYVQTGKASVFAFNQQAVWQNFNLEWWKNQTSSVGVEFQDPLKFVKSYKEITIQESAWSFFHLLNRADMDGSGAVSWVLETPTTFSRPMSIRFSAKSDPWAVFHLGCNIDQSGS